MMLLSRGKQNRAFVPYFFKSAITVYPLNEAIYIETSPQYEVPLSDGLGDVR